MQGDPAAVGTGQPNHRAGGIGLRLRGQRLTEMFAVIGMDPLRTPPVDQWAGLIDPLQGAPVVQIDDQPVLAGLLQAVEDPLDQRV